MELFRCTTGLGTKLVLLEALLGPSLASISDSCLKQESPQTKLPTSANLYSIKQLQIHYTHYYKKARKRQLSWCLFCKTSIKWVCYRVKKRCAFKKRTDEQTWTQAAVIVSRIALVVWLLDLRRMVRCSTSTALLAQNVNTEGSVTCISNTECNRPN